MYVEAIAQEITAINITGTWHAMVTPVLLFLSTNSFHSTLYGIYTQYIAPRVTGVE